jgi:hypothetical protein
MKTWFVPAFAAIGGMCAAFFAHKRTALQVYENNEAAKLRWSRAVRVHSSRVYPWPWRLIKWWRWHQVHIRCHCPFKEYVAGKKRIPLLEHWAQRTMKPQNIEFSLPRVSLKDMTNFSLGFDIQFKIVKLQKALQYGKIEDEKMLPEAFKRFAKSVFQELLLDKTFTDILDIKQLCQDARPQLAEWAEQFGLEIDWVRATDINASVQTEDVLLAPVRLEQVKSAIKDSTIEINDPAALALLARFSAIAGHQPGVIDEVDGLDELEEAVAAGGSLLTLAVPGQTTSAQTH